MNVTVNPLTALLQVQNGVLLKAEETKSLARSIVKEACQVFSAEVPEVMAGEGMTGDELAEEMLRNLVPMGEDFSSMFEDVRSGEETEM